MDLFDFNNNNNKLSPLADRMRANSLNEFIGQGHILSESSLLRRAIMADKLGSCIFWGPPGCGKTTLANVIANMTKAEFVKMNAVTSGVADVKRVVEEAKNLLKMHSKRTFLLLDECHRFNKTQLDSLLPAVEQGHIIFIGSTTENPFISLTPAIVSRCRVFELKRLSDDEIYSALFKCVDDVKGLKGLNIELAPDAASHIVWAANGDLRFAYNALELAALTCKANEDGVKVITVLDAEESAQKKSLSVDENLYYDMLSAFCKSLRGSDPDAALYYSERLLTAGCDPLLILRRLIIHSAEDVGMADPNALTIATSAMYAFERIGLPEGKIPLSQAIIYVCLAEKSNSVVEAIAAATEVVNSRHNDSVPLHLRDRHYSGNSKRNGVDTYLYPHEFGGYVKQQYLPDEVADAVIYTPKENGYEGKIDFKKRNDK